MSKIILAAVTAAPEHLPVRRSSSAETPGHTERRSALLQFLADPPREVAEAALAMREAGEQYGDDTDRELVDLEAGHHPLQRLKAEYPTG